MLIAELEYFDADLPQARHLVVIEGQLVDEKDVDKIARMLIRRPSHCHRASGFTPERLEVMGKAGRPRQ